MPYELRDIFNRLGVVESAQKDAAIRATDRNTEVQKELVRMDEWLKGVREQAKAHYEENVKSIVALKLQMSEDKRTLETMIINNVKELYTGIDRIITALGLNESPEAGGELRTNLKTLADMLIARKEDIMWIRRGVITISISGVGMLLVFGAKSILGGT